MYSIFFKTFGISPNLRNVATSIYLGGNLFRVKQMLMVTTAREVSCLGRRQNMKKKRVFYVPTSHITRVYNVYVGTKLNSS